MRRIQELNDHFIVCGAGRMGRVVARELLRTGRAFVIIEQDPVRVTSLLEEEPGLLFIEGDATREQMLRAAGVGRAHGLAADGIAGPQTKAALARVVRDGLNVPVGMIRVATCMSSRPKGDSARVTSPASSQTASITPSPSASALIRVSWCM